ncbi:MAG TPA: neocarzinostatin apoprotein domain-containing protein [Polyangiaceae bacterium]
MRLVRLEVLWFATLFAIVILHAGAARADISVTVTPNTDLQDGQTLLVSASGLVPNESIGFDLCVRYPYGQLDGCSLHDLLQLTADAAGSVQTPFVVKKAFTTVSGATITCELPGDCSIALFSSEPTRATPITFHYDYSSPELRVSPSSELQQDQLVTLTGSGFKPNSGVSVYQCKAGFMNVPGECAQLPGVLADDNGAFTTDVQVSYFTHQTGFCEGPGACVVAAMPRDVRVYGATAALAFRPVAPPRTGTITVTPNALIAGGTVTVVGRDWAPLSQVVVGMCSSASPFCSGPPHPVDDAGSFSTSFVTKPTLIGHFGTATSFFDCTASPNRCAIFAHDIRTIDAVSRPLTLTPIPTKAGRATLELGTPRTEWTVPGTLRGKGWSPRRTLQVAQCPSQGAAPCVSLEPIVTDDSGRFDTPTTLKPKVFDVESYSLDCYTTPRSCSLLIADEQSFDATAVRIPLDFTAPPACAFRLATSAGSSWPWLGTLGGTLLLSWSRRRKWCRSLRSSPQHRSAICRS